MTNRSIKQHIKNILTYYEIKIRNKTKCEDLQQETGTLISSILILLSTIILLIFNKFTLATIITVLCGYLIANIILIILNRYQAKKHKNTVELADKVLEDELYELEKELETVKSSNHEKQNKIR